MAFQLRETSQNKYNYNSYTFSASVRTKGPFSSVQFSYSICFTQSYNKNYDGCADTL